MAIYNQDALTQQSDLTYVTNNNNEITAADVRALNQDWISSSVLIPMTSSMTVGFATTAYTASSISNLTQDVIVSGSTRGSVKAVSVSSNTASFDLSDSNFFTVTLATSATTHLNFTNPLPGQTSNVVVTTVTGNAVSFSSNVKQPTGSAYSPSAPGNIDILSVITVDNSNVYIVNARRLS